jgi:adenylate kinase family enzyme
LESSHEVLKARLLKHASRLDDNIEAIEKRLVSYEESSIEVIVHYNALDKIKSVNSDKRVSEVTQDIFLHFENL